MPEIFQSSHFGFLPALEDVVEQVEAAKLGCVRNIELFKFSSCTPAFQVDLERTDGSADRIVMRGEQQNDLLVMSPEERSIEKEIWMLNRVRDLGLDVPEVFADSRIFAVPGFDQEGNSAEEFRFFLMGFVPGMAMDRRIKEGPVEDQPRLIERVGEIYARVHSVTGPQYGLTDGAGQAVFGESELQAFLIARTKRLADLVSHLGDEEFANAFLAFGDEVIGLLCKDIAASDYRPQPRLCLIDGFCGNMLIEGEEVSLIDMAMGGYFEAVTEFCAFIYPLKSMLLEEHSGMRHWDRFAAAYREHGGVLPPDELAARLLHIMFVHVLVQQLIYWKESPSAKQQAKVAPLVATVMTMMKARPQDMEAVIEMI